MNLGSIRGKGVEPLPCIVQEKKNMERHIRTSNNSVNGSCRLDMDPPVSLGMVDREGQGCPDRQQATDR